MPFNSQKLLKQLAENNPKVLFYPSSSHSHQGIFNLGYDIFIFSDYYPKNPRMRDEFYTKFKSADSRLVLYKSTDKCRISRLEEKWVFLYFEDNNKVLKKIQKAGLQLSCFIGLNDGCCEGGNYECVNESIWLKKVFQILENGGLYITDHSKTLFPELFNLNKNRKPPKKPFLYQNRILNLIWNKKAIRMNGSIIGYTITTHAHKNQKQTPINLNELDYLAKDLTFRPQLSNYIMAFEVYFKD